MKTKTEYEKELEREIKEYKEHCKKHSAPWKIEDLEDAFPDLTELIKLKAKLEGYKKAKQEEREKILKEFEKFWKQFEKDYDIDGRKIKFELLDSDLEFLKTKTKEIIKKNE